MSSTVSFVDYKPVQIPVGLLQNFSFDNHLFYYYPTLNSTCLQQQAHQSIFLNIYSWLNFNSDFVLYISARHLNRATTHPYSY